MFDSFRERLQTAQHDLSEGFVCCREEFAFQWLTAENFGHLPFPYRLRSIADKAKAVNKKIVR